MTFNDFVHKHNLKNKATSNIKSYQVLDSVGLDNVGIYSRDGSFSTDIGIVDLHPSKGTHWVCYINENSFDTFGCVPPRKLSKFIIKRNRHCLYSEYNVQGLTNRQGSYCATYCLYIIYLTNVLGIDFKPVVFNLYYQYIRAVRVILIFSFAQ